MNRHNKPSGTVVADGEVMRNSFAFEEVACIENWLTVQLDDRPSFELTHYASITMKDGRRWSGFLTTNQWRDVQSAELKHEMFNA